MTLKTIPDWWGTLEEKRPPQKSRWQRLKSLLRRFFGLTVIITIPVVENEFKFYEYDELLGWRNKPGAVGWHEVEGNRYRVRINQEGMRDSLINRSKKIALYGDSFTWGYGLAEEDRFSNIFETLTDWEVLNYGVAGYGTDQMYLALQRQTQSTEWVIFVCHSGDLVDNQRTVNSDYPKPKFRVRGSQLVLTNVPVPKKSNWIHRVGDAYEQIAGDNPQELMLALLDVAREKSRQFALILVPNRWELQNSPLAFVRDFAAQKNIPCLDGSTILIAEDFLQEGHLNQAGNRVIAEALRKLLP